MSSSMRAMVYSGAGGPEVIAVRDVSRVEPGPKQVRIKVKAAGLNRADLLQRRGLYPAPHGWPADIPGLEYAGEVETLGSGVGRWKVGDRVMGLVGGGACAEFVVVHEDETMRVPDGITFEQAAVIPEAFLTAYDALVARGNVRPGERVLIHAAASGVGTAAVQLAKLFGATTIGTTRSAAKLERLEEYGLDEGIDTSRDNFMDVIGEPVHVVLDVLGGPAFHDNLAILASRGRLVMLGHLSGTHATVDLSPILRKRLEVIGSMMRTRGLQERQALVREFAEAALPLFVSKDATAPALRPVLEVTYPMTALGDAHRAMESNATFGKIALAW